MARKIMSEYRITYQDGTEKLAVRSNSIQVTEDFEDMDDPMTNPINQIQRTRTGLDVNIPEITPPVFFRMSVTPQAAADAGSIATPQQFTIPSGRRIVAQAMPGAGFVFTGWFLSAPVYPEDVDFDPAVPVSTDLTAVLVVTAPGPGQERVFEARFQPAP